VHHQHEVIHYHSNDVRFPIGLIEVLSDLWRAGRAYSVLSDVAALVN